MDVLTGEVFTHPKTDLFLPGPFNLQIDRTYSSFATRRDVGLGWGWTHSLAWSGEIRREEIVIWNGLGQTISFPKLPNVGDSSSLGGWSLLRGSNCYVLRAGDEFLHIFGRNPEARDELLLLSIKYRNLGEFELRYQRGKLTEVIDAAGRTVQFVRDVSGRIAALQVPSPSGQSLVFSRYSYDQAGNLSEAIDADGNRWGYAYDDLHRLTTMAVPGPPGLLFRYCYDAKGRCYETWGEREDGLAEPCLVPNLPALLADGRTKAKGILHASIEFGEDGYVEVADSVRVQRFFAGTAGKTEKAINGRGGVTSRQIDPEGNITAHTDANGATWTYVYDDVGQVIDATDAEGRRVRYTRDGEGRILRAQDGTGRVFEYGRNAHGHIEWVRSPKGGMTIHRYDSRGLLSESTDPSGRRTRYERDSHGNVTRVIHPNQSSTVLTYDFWGRRTKETLPDGRTFNYLFSASGKIIEARDDLGRSRQFAYDALGNVLQEREADGSGWLHRMGGLGWLASSKDPLGGEVRGFYNREGWLVTIVNERGETTEHEHNATGVVVRQKTFDGRVVRYLRDARDYIVAIVDAAGKTTIERNKVGQITSIVGPDGSAREFEYDQSGALAVARAPGTAMSWQRDADGEILRETVTVNGSNYFVETSRDLMGRRLLTQTSLGHVVEVKRDESGDPQELIADGGEVVRFKRDAMGWPLRRELPRGGAIVDELDGAGRLRKRSVQTAGAEARARSDEPAYLGTRDQAVEKAYQYSPVDELVSVTTSDGGTIEFEYDLRHQLLNRRSRTDNESFQYDAVGNPLEAGVTPVHREYDAGSRLKVRGSVEYEYDTRGRVAAKHTQLSDGKRQSTRYHYDAFNLLRSVELPDGLVINNVYDAFARRIEKRVSKRQGARVNLVSTTHYIWDQVSVVHQIESRFKGVREVTTFLYETPEDTVPIAERQQDTGDWLHYVHEVSGAPEEVVDSEGRLVARAKHSVYGLWRWSSDGGVQAKVPFRFPGQMADAETGLFYNRYRTYDPETGRYLTPDPLGLDGGFNLYSYGPNPVGWFDPMGWHTMNVTKKPDGFNATHATDKKAKGGPQYESGMDNCPGGPPQSENLKSRARCHTEQKFAHDLIKSGKKFKDKDFTLTGELPPCPNCHRALQHASDESGANVQYQWKGPGGEMQTITYKPKTPPTGSGSQATQLVSADGTKGAYKTTADTDRRNGYRYNDYGKASSTYTKLSGQLDNDED